MSCAVKHNFTALNDTLKPQETAIKQMDSGLPYRQAEAFLGQQSNLARAAMREN